jgi:lysophospholipase L1-like esterase
VLSAAGQESPAEGAGREETPDEGTRGRRSRLPWDRVLLATLGVAAALLLGEAATRLVGPADPKVTGYAPVKTKGRGAEPTNSREYRDLERSVAKPRGTHRIVSLGDSIAWGFGVEFEDAYPQRVERSLTRHRGERWEVVNLARPGMNSVEETQQLADEGLAYEPDLVILGYCLNDSEDAKDAEARRNRYWQTLQRERAGQPSLLERSTLYAIVARRIEATVLNRRRIAAYEAQYAADYAGWLSAQQALRSMTALCRRRGIPFVVVIFPLFGNPLGDAYPFAAIHSKVASVARDAGAVAIDLLPAYRDLRWELLVVDGPNDEHPNEIAHRIAAATILRTVNELVEAAPPR